MVRSNKEGAIMKIWKLQPVLVAPLCFAMLLLVHGSGAADEKDDVARYLDDRLDHFAEGRPGAGADSGAVRIAAHDRLHGVRAVTDQ